MTKPKQQLENVLTRQLNILEESYRILSIYSSNKEKELELAESSGKERLANKLELQMCDIDDINDLLYDAINRIKDYTQENFFSGGQPK